MDAQGFRTSVIDARFMKPLDEELILRLARSMSLLTLEEARLAAGGQICICRGKRALEGGLKCRSGVAR